MYLFIHSWPNKIGDFVRKQSLIFTKGPSEQTKMNALISILRCHVIIL